MPKMRFVTIGMGIISLLFCIYSTIFIYNTSFVICDTRYFALFDDAMVSMRYAKNLAAGYGLVWNPGGARVEGFTNPLWVFCMALVHLLPIQAPQVSLVIQILGAALLLINLFVCKRIADLISDRSTFVALAACTFIAFYLPLNNWALQGMEVSIATLMLSVAILLALKSLNSGRFSSLLLILLAVLTTIRMDLLIPALIIIGVLFVAQQDQRRKHILGALIVLAVVLDQTIFRHEYYGALLPNTYYLKMVGYPTFFRITRGLYVTADFIAKTSWVLCAIPFIVLAIKRKYSIALLVALISAQTLYSLYVGGDAWEWWGGSNRYISIIMPAFFILIAYGLDSLRLDALTTFPQLKRLIQPLSVVVVVLCLLNFNATRGAETWGEWLLFVPPVHVAENRRHVEQALLIKQITSDQAKVAVVFAGELPYFADRYMIDMLGKNDFEIGHATMRTTFGFDQLTYFYPGHLKWNYAYSIGTLRPDLVAELWKIPTEAKPLLDSDYEEVTIRGFQMYLRKGSPSIKWDVVDTIR